MRKKQFLTAFTLILILAACSRKLTPVVNAEKKSETDKVVNNENADKSTMIAEGEKLYTARCGKCHELHKPEEFTASEWPSILRSMAPKAKLNQSMKDMVMAYVTANAKKQ